MTVTETAGAEEMGDVATWQQVLLEVQAEIARLDPHPYYLQAYRAAERHYWERVAQWMFEDSRSQPRTRCLDIGCAYGTLALFAKRLWKCEVYCTDFMDAYLSPALVSSHGFFYAVNNLETEKFPWVLDFDVIIFTEVLEHFNFHPVPSLKRIRSLLADGGTLYLSTPDAAEWGRVTKYYRTLAEIPYPKAGVPVVDDHVYQYSEEELRAVLDQSGFVIERFDYSLGSGLRHFNLTLK
jgi:SAM-dependent methyltransferase